MSKSAKPVSEIDRLIRLASDDKPHPSAVTNDSGKSNHSLSLEDQKDPNPSMWRVLLQLRVFLPYLAKVLPLVERGLLGTNLTGHAAPSFDTTSLDRGITGIGEAQRDLNTAVKAQSAELRRLQDQVTALSDSVEKVLQLNQENTGKIHSLTKLVTNSVWVIFVLLAVLLGLVGFAVFAHLARVG